MNRCMAWILTLLILLTAAVGSAETQEQLFARLEGVEWSFSSGAGAWSTDLRLLPDGSFSGEFHDSDMGDSTDEYPEGTVYFCAFSGQMTLQEQLDENTWRLRVDSLKPAADQEPESIADGVRYVAAEPYGLSEGDTMILYAPGTPVSTLPEEKRFWAHVTEMENQSEFLETWFLSSEQNDSGFVGFQPEPSALMPNPWKDMTAEELREASGLSFGIPEGAKDITYRYLPSEGLAEMDFIWEDSECCARIQPAALKEGEWMNISGMYFSWENEEPVQIRHCSGTVGMAQTGSEDWVVLCQWYDAAPGLMYSLSLNTVDPDGLDPVALAEQIYLPVQGDA